MSSSSEFVDSLVSFFSRLGLPIINHKEAVEDSSLWPMGWVSFGVAIIIVVLLFLLLLWMSKYNKKSTHRGLTKWFAIVWTMGFVVYDVGMYTGNPWSLLTNSPMAIIHAFGMFILDSDVSAIHVELHTHWIYMFAFSVAHIAAAVVSMFFVIKHFGFNIMAGIKMARERRKTKKTLYVFWGMNSATYYLAKSIKEHHKSKNYRIVVVRANSDGDSTSERTQMERLFSFISLKNRDLDRLKELGCLTTNAFASPATLDIPKDAAPGNVDIIGNVLGLKALRKLIKKTSGDVHMFFLSENEKANILAVANMKSDKTINEIVSKVEPNNLKDKGTGIKVTLYCRARYNSVHRVIEDAQINHNIKVRVVDSSHISVETLKRNVDLHPVNYVDVERDATVSSMFNSLVVGFGEVGIDVVRFLYEMGAFVKTGSSDENVLRSDFHCNVVDGNMDEFAGMFYANAPFIAPAMPFVDGREDDSSLITLHKLESNSVEFYNRLNEWIKDLNYVVVALGNAEVNMSLAIRIFRLAIRYRESLDKLRILIYVPEDEGGHMGRIVEHYNRLWAAELNKEGKDGTQKMIKKAHIAKQHGESPVNSPLSIFGLAEKTYNYDYILDDSIINDAKLYKEKYGISTNTETDWDKEHNLRMQLDDEHKDYSPTYSNVTCLMRTEIQNICNSVHRNTKIRLAELALGKESVVKLAQALKDGVVSRETGKVSYNISDLNNLDPDQICEVLHTLAQTEHLRWNASHGLLGYRFGDKKDELHGLHNCLRPWQELSEETQSYDCNVVDVSFIMHCEENEKRKKI